MIRNIIFDWSGTLVDDLPAVWQASNHVFRRAGVPELSLERFRAEFCLPFKPFYDRHVPHVGIEQLEEWFHGHFREAQESVVALPHAREFLEFCRARLVRTYVLSTVHPDHFAVQQANTGFGEFIDRPYLGVLDKRKKIHDILAENRLAPDQTIFIGDMQHDIETARHGGIGSCAVLTGYNSAEQLRAAQPDVMVEHLGELRALLERQEMRLKPEREPVRRDPFRLAEARAERRVQEKPSPSSPKMEGAGVKIPPVSNGSPGAAGLLTAAPALRAERKPDVPATQRPVATVGAVIFDRAGRVLMIRTHKWSNLWGIPGGKIEFGERAEDALRRELKEETNLDVTDIRFVLAQDCIHSKEFHRDEHFVLLNYTCRATGTGRVQLNEEAQQFRWLPLADAFNLALNQPTKVLLAAIAASPPAQDTKSKTPPPSTPAKK